MVTHLHFILNSIYFQIFSTDPRTGFFLQKSDFPSEEDYSIYLEHNISPGLLVKVQMLGYNFTIKEAMTF